MTHTFGRNPLDEGSARRSDLYLTTHNTHKTQRAMPRSGFEPAIPASKRPQTDALEGGQGDRLLHLLWNTNPCHWRVGTKRKIGNKRDWCSRGAGFETWSQELVW